MTAPQLHLPRTVASDQTERAVDLLQLYFKSRKFIGSQWDGFDPSGTRAASANVFTSDDVASAALLNTPVPGHAVVHLLITQRERFAGLLEAVGPDRDFIDADPDLIFLADTKCCGQDASTVAARPGWADLTAVQQDGVVELDDDIASRWGPRIVDFLEAIVDATADVEAGVAG